MSDAAPSPSNSDLRVQTEPRKTLAQAFLENWHQNASGLIALGCVMGGIWGPVDMQSKFAASAAAFGAYFAGHAKGKQAGEADK